jgi:putative ATP-dependent endonuclease of OLD family
MIGALAQSGPDKDIILLVEEPESHLHPKAIHQLREVLEDLRKENQIVVTTHCPLFVNRGNVASNFIVSKNQAVRARNLADIRDVLGVRASDNLRHAALVIVVEGPEDEKAIRALIGHYSPSLLAAMSNGSLAFEVLTGASKLPYALSLLQSFVCNYSIFLDDDEEGRRAYREAEQALLASSSNTTFAKCVELPETEFEDLLDPRFYAPYFQTKYGVDVTHRPFDEKKKWSDRIRFGIKTAGKGDWPEKEEYEDKRDKLLISCSKPLLRQFTRPKNLCSNNSQNLLNVDFWRYLSDSDTEVTKQKALWTNGITQLLVRLIYWNNLEGIPRCGGRRVRFPREPVEDRSEHQAR